MLFRSVLAHVQLDDDPRTPIQQNVGEEFRQHNGVVTILMFYHRRASPHRCADGTLPRHSAGSESGDHHRAKRVLELGDAVVSVLDRSGREDVRLHQPRCANASAFGLRGYVDNTLPSRCCASP